MKYRIIQLLILLIMNIVVYSNNTLNSTDSLNIAYKAKLLTLSNWGISDSNEVLKNIIKQKVEFISINEHEDSLFSCNNFIFLRVYYDQYYLLKYSNISNSQGTFNNCSFLLGYNINDAIFYRLCGFSSLDYKLFTNHISKSICYDVIKSHSDLKLLKSKRKFKKLCNKLNSCSDKPIFTIIVK